MARVLPEEAAQRAEPTVLEPPCHIRAPAARLISRVQCQGEHRLRHNPLIDPRELEQLHDQCFSWALTCTRGHRNEAEDVLQMTYLAIIEGNAHFDGGSSLKTWMFAVIRNQARSRSRRIRYCAALADTHRRVRCRRRQQPSRTPTHIASSQRCTRCRIGNAKCSTWSSIAVLRSPEAATVLGIGLGTARTHYERGKAALRRQLDPTERTR